MKSLGVIETKGLVVAIQAVDAACKSAGVTCIGYRKVGSGLVSVCFEGEISAIHTAIERGVAVAAAIDSQVKSLVIARPEPCVVQALSRLKGHPAHSDVRVNKPAKPVVPVLCETNETPVPVTPAVVTQAVLPEVPTVALPAVQVEKPEVVKPAVQVEKPETVKSAVRPGALRVAKAAPDQVENKNAVTRKGKKA